MNRLMLSAVVLLGLAGGSSLIGCDRTVAHTHTEDVKSDGTSVSKDTKVTKNSDGSVTKTETKDVNK